MIKIISYILYNYIQVHHINDLCDRVTGIEISWLEKLKKEIKKSNLEYKDSMYETISDLIKTAKALEIESKIFNQTEILNAYDNVTITPDNKTVILKIKLNQTEINLGYPLSLELDLLRLDKKDIISSSYQLLNSNLYDFEFNLLYKNKVVLDLNNTNYKDINLEELHYILNLENFFQEEYKDIFKFINSIAFKEYESKREIIPEILYRNKTENLINSPSTESLNSLQQIIIEKKLGINSIGSYKSKIFKK